MVRALTAFLAFVFSAAPVFSEEPLLDHQPMIIVEDWVLARSLGNQRHLVGAGSLGLEAIVDRPDVILDALHVLLSNRKGRTVLDAVEHHFAPIEELSSLGSEIRTDSLYFTVIGDVRARSGVLAGKRANDGSEAPTSSSMPPRPSKAAPYPISSKRGSSAISRSRRRSRFFTHCARGPHRRLASSRLATAYFGGRLELRARLATLFDGHNVV